MNDSEASGDLMEINVVRQIVLHCQLPFTLSARVRDAKDCAGVIQVGMFRADTYTGKISMGWSGKYRVSRHAIESEIVQALFGLCLQYLEHELREGFMWRPNEHHEYRRVFNPHIDILQHWNGCKKTAYRKPVK